MFSQSRGPGIECDSNPEIPGLVPLHRKCNKIEFEYSSYAGTGRDEKCVELHNFRIIEVSLHEIHPVCLQLSVGF